MLACKTPPVATAPLGWMEVPKCTGENLTRCEEFQWRKKLPCGANLRKKNDIRQKENEKMHNENLKTDKKKSFEDN